MRLRTGWLVLAAGALACGAEPAVRRLELGRLGTLRIFAPEAARESFVVIFSDASGWVPALDGVARGIAASGATVVGVDLPETLRRLAASDDGCHYVVAEIEDLAHRLERELGFERYRSPLLAGIGAGATLAYAALAQSPAATVEGAVAVDPAQALATRVPLCAGAPSSQVAGGFHYAAQEPLPGTWRLGSESSATGDSAARLLAAVRAVLAEEHQGPDAELADLPVIEIPAVSPGARAAVIYSGDGGWRDLDKEIGENLSLHDVSVVGVDSLRYFWRARTPDEVARDLARIVRFCRERRGAREILLVGYSFGAGILPFAVNRLPEAERSAIVQISLLGLEPRAPFEIEVAAWMGAGPSAAAPPVLPELLRLDLSRVQCFYGEDEEATLCRDPALAQAEIVHTSGGHHFDGDFAALARAILAGAERRSPAPAEAHFATMPLTPPETSAATSVSTSGVERPPGEAR